MNLKLIATRGLPASGKTTWAKEMLENNPGKYKRINKDLLREMFDGGKHSKGNENFILAIRDSLIYEALVHGYNVIVDDTNFAPKHEQRLREIADSLCQTHVVNFEIQDFSDVPVEVCLERDKNRVNSVGPEVIWRMYRQYLKKPIEPYPVDPNLQNCVICDLDGTLVKIGDRNPYDASNCDLVDTLNRHVSDVVYAFADFKKARVIFLSGREDKDREATIRFLTNNSWEYYFLAMRPTGDNRPDNIVKEELFNIYIRGKYNVLAVFDDRMKVVRLWQSMGLPVFNCGNSEEF